MGPARGKPYHCGRIRRPGKAIPRHDTFAAGATPRTFVGARLRAIGAAAGRYRAQARSHRGIGHARAARSALRSRRRALRAFQRSERQAKIT